MMDIEFKKYTGYGYEILEDPFTGNLEIEKTLQYMTRFDLLKVLNHISNKVNDDNTFLLLAGFKKEID